MTTAFRLLFRAWRLLPWPRRVAPLGAALLLGACAAPLPERPVMPHGEGLFWRVEKPGLQPSYVFGTMHVPDEDVLDLPPVIEKAFTQTKQTAFELVTPRDEAVERLRRFVAAAMLPEGQSLSKLMDSASYAQLIRIARRQSSSSDMIGRTHISEFKPWFVMLVIGKDDASASHLDPKAPSLDDWLEARAKRAGNKVVGLETFEEQLNVFDGMSMPDQLALLSARLDDYNMWRGYYVSKDLYLSGDTAMFYGIWHEDLRHLDPAVARRITDRFLDHRNHRMVERMLPLLERQATFVAVGALHLPGEEGILRLLEQRGFTVTRLH